MQISTRIILSFSLLALGCTSHAFTASSPGVAYRPLAPTTVEVFHTAPPGSVYREIGVLEVVAESYADAREHFQRLGGENGCQAVRAFTTRTNVVGAARVTSSETVYLGSCLVSAVD